MAGTRGLEPTAGHLGVDGERRIGHARDGELLARPAARCLAEAIAGFQRRLETGGQRCRIVRRDEHARLAVGNELGQRADARRHHGPSGEHRLEHRKAEALPPHGMHDRRRALEPRRHVRHASGQIHGNAKLLGQRFECAALRALAEHDEVNIRIALAHESKGPNRDVDALLPFEPAHREDDPRVGRNVVRRVAPPRLRRSVEPVMDRRQLVRRKTHALGLKPGEGIRDRDHPRRAPRERTFDEAKRPGAERIVVVFGRDDRRGAKSPVDVGVHEMGVDDIRTEPTNRAGNLEREPRIDVPRCPQAFERDVELLVERIGSSRGVVEPEEVHVDAPLGKRRKQRQQMTFGPADPADPLEVEDLHARLRRRNASRAAPAESAIRKSQAMR